MIKEYLQKVFYLLDDDKQKIPRLTLLFILLSLFDIFGISIVASYISFISNDIAVDNIMIQIFEVIGWSIEKDRLLLDMGLLIIAIFLAKTFFSISLNKIIIKFSLKQKIKLSSFLMNTYQSLPYVQYLNRNSSEYIHSIRSLTETFSSLILLLLRTFSALSNTLIFLRFSSDSLKKLFDDVQKSKKSKIKRVVDGYQLSSEKFREFELDNVSFSYPDKASDVIKNISMKVAAGEAVGIIGPSGAGKTTLIDLILCLLDPSGGSIKYNNSESELSLLEWRSQIAYLPQQVFIIDDTLKANIALGVDNVDNTQLNYAIKKAKLESLVNYLSDGVETFVGEKGIRLSGGERQRVALARAFYHDKNILVMDESTSSLDVETEKEIIKEIKNLRGIKTLIVIAHRMSTVQHCNWIYHIENGRVIKSGKFEEIVS